MAHPPDLGPARRPRRVSPLLGPSGCSVRVARGVAPALVWTGSACGCLALGVVGRRGGRVESCAAGYRSGGSAVGLCGISTGCGGWNMFYADAPLRCRWCVAAVNAAVAYSRCLPTRCCPEARIRTRVASDCREPDADAEARCWRSTVTHVVPETPAALVTVPLPLAPCCCAGRAGPRLYRSPPGSRAVCPLRLPRRGVVTVGGDGFRSARARRTVASKPETVPRRTAGLSPAPRGGQASMPSVRERSGRWSELVPAGGDAGADDRVALVAAARRATPGRTAARLGWDDLRELG